MTSTVDTYESFKFTPTEALVLEVLTARNRLGENVWTLEARLNQTLAKLEARDLIGYKSASVEGYSLVWFTDAGVALMLERKYNGPLKFSELKDHQKSLRKRAQRFLRLKAASAPKE